MDIVKCKIEYWKKFDKRMQTSHEHYKNKRRRKQTILSSLPLVLSWGYSKKVPFTLVSSCSQPMISSAYISQREVWIFPSSKNERLHVEKSWRVVTETPTILDYERTEIWSRKPNFVLCIVQFAGGSSKGIV